MSILLRSSKQKLSQTKLRSLHLVGVIISRNLLATVICAFSLLFSLNGWGQTTITIGSGTINSFDVPINMSDCYSYAQMIYTASQINAQGVTGAQNLTAIQFSYAGSTHGGVANNWNLFVGNTAKTNFSSTTDWVASGNLTQVYSGAVSVPSCSCASTSQWYTVTFTTPFTWDGTSNLVIAVQETNSGNNNPIGHDYTASPTYISLTRANSSSISPSTPGTGARSTMLPNIKMTFSPACTNPSISGQSTAAQTVCQNGTFSNISVTAAGTSPTYQWYSNTSASNSGGTSLGNANGAQTNTYTPQASSTGILYYYCVVTACSTTVTSAVSGAMTVNAVPSISAQPSAGTICVGGTYSPSVTAAGGVSLSYQWQYSTSSGGTYNNVANGTPANSTYTNATTNNLSVTGSIAAGSSYYYKCVVSSTGSGCSSVTSTPVQLTVNAVPSISAQSSAGSICVGGTFSPSVTAAGGVSLSYQWQYSTSSGGTYNNVANGTPANSTYTNATTNNLSVTGSIAAGSSHYYKCVVSSTGSGCSNATSTPVQLTVNAVPSISAQSSAGSICVGGTFSPSITVAGGVSLSYQWQYSTSSGGTYNNVTNGTPTNSTYTNAITNNLSVTGSIAAGSAYYYQCIVSSTGSGCTSVTSTPVQLTINSALAGTYAVGPTGVFTTLTDALNIIRSCGMSASVILELQSNYTDGSETYPMDFSGLPTASNKTLTIRPNSSVASALTLDGSTTTTLLDFNTTDYVTIDGRPGGTGSNKYITIENTSTATGGSAIKLSNDASSNTFQYCTFRSNYSASNEGVINFSTTTGSTGNDNNTISYCVIDGKAGATASPTSGVARNGIYSAGTAAKTNSSNTISYCEFKDIFVTGGTITNQMIYLDANNTSWTIQNNSFYQSSSRTATVGATSLYCIRIAGGDAYNIISNFIGGNSANCSGTWTQSLTGSITTPFYGISLTAAAAGTNSTISSNTISGFNVPLVSASDPWRGIEVLAGNVTIGGSNSADGNIIGATTGTGSITLIKANNSTASIFTAIDVTSANTIGIQNNKIGSITVTNANNQSITFTGIQTASTATYTISDNTIGTTVTSNIQMSGTSISASFTAISNTGTSGVTISSNYIGGYDIGAGYFTGISDNAAATVLHTISSNTIGGTSSNDILVRNGDSEGIDIGSTGTYTINDNIIRNISNSYSGSNIIYGIRGGSTGTYNMSGNTISNLKQTTTNSGGGTIAGIYFANVNTSSLIQKNKLTGFSTKLTSGSTIAGIWSSTSGAVRLYNNLFVCDNDGYTVDCKIFGIYDGGSTVITMYYNTISISGIQANVIQNPSSSCLYHPGAVASKIQACKNNIFKNDRTAGGSSDIHYSYFVGGNTVVVATAGAVDYNYYAAPKDANFAYPGAAKTATTFNASTQGYGGLNSKYYSPNGGSATGNSSAITINFDGSISCSDASIVGLGADLNSIVSQDIVGTARAVVSGVSGGTKGCFETSAPSTPTAGSNSNVCVGSSLNLTSTTVSGATYSWTGPNSFTSSSQNPSISGVTAAAAGTYSVTATVSGCNSSAGTVSVTINNPAPSAVASGDYIWRGVTSADWNTASNWVTYNGSTYSVPASAPLSTSTPNVIIPATSTSCAVSNFPNTLATTVYGKSVTIESGASVTMGAGGTMYVSGDWTNNGTFACGTSTVEFNGSSNNSINGTTTFYHATINKGTSIATVLDVNGTITQTDGSANLTFTKGLLRIPSGGSWTKTSGGPTIGANSGLHVNGGDFTLNGASISNSGLFRVTTGTANIGNGSGNSITNLSNSIFTVDGSGTVNVAGRIQFTTAGTYTQSAGTVNVCTVANTSGSIANFDIDAATTVNISGGTILIKYPNSNATPYSSLRITSGAGSKTISGGTIQIGDASSSSNFLIYSDVALNNLTINASGNATLESAITANGTITFTNGKFVMGNYDFSIGSSGLISGESSSTYFVTSGTGVLTQKGINSSSAAGKKMFPIGISTASYTPMVLANTGTSDDFSARVTTGVLSAGTSGSVLTTKYVDRTWLISEGTSGGSEATVNLYWNAAEEQSPSFNRSACFITHYTGGAWDLSTATAASGTPYTTFRSGITSFSPFTVTSTSALPIELTSFQANCSDNKTVDVTWTTASEHNTNYFRVDKSRNGTQWDVLGTIGAAGNSTYSIDYALTDAFPQPGINYYRLTQYDLDGVFETFDSQAAVCSEQQAGTALSTYPNPSSSYFNVDLQTDELEGEGVLIVTDAKGAVVYSQNITIINGTNNYIIQRFEAAPGIYYISVKAGANSVTTKHSMR